MLKYQFSNKVTQDDVGEFSEDRRAIKTPEMHGWGTIGNTVRAAFLDPRVTEVIIKFDDDVAIRVWEEV